MYGLLRWGRYVDRLKILSHLAIVNYFTNHPMIALPQLSTDGLRHISVCSFSDLTDASESVRSAYNARPKYSHSKLSGDGGDIYVRRIINVDEDDEGHYHVEAAVSESFSKLPKVTSALEEALALPSDIDGRSVRAMIEAHFGVPPDSAIARRLVKSLQGVSFDAGGYKLAVAGCTFNVLDGEPLFRIRWAMREKDKIEIEFYLFADLVIKDDYLTASAQLVDKAVRSLTKA